MKFVCALLLCIASLARSEEEETEEEYLNRRRLILPAAAAGAASWAAIQELVGLTASGAVVSNFAMSGSHGVNLRIENHLCSMTLDWAGNHVLTHGEVSDWGNDIRPNTVEQMSIGGSTGAEGAVQYQLRGTTYGLNVHFIGGGCSLWAHLNKFSDCERFNFDGNWLHVFWSQYCFKGSDGQYYTKKEENCFYDDEDCTSDCCKDCQSKCTRSTYYDGLAECFMSLKPFDSHDENTFTWHIETLVSWGWSVDDTISVGVYGKTGFSEVHDMASLHVEYNIGEGNTPVANVVVESTNLLSEGSSCPASAKSPFTRGQVAGQDMSEMPDNAQPADMTGQQMRETVDSMHGLFIILVAVIALNVVCFCTRFWKQCAGLCVRSDEAKYKSVVLDTEQEAESENELL